ncbi:hypothetical protein [Arthrobacter sp.]|uniref:hypothetical protein n=1 Tax=Arthrobacter sp. TaxID=1667 RepID=UPI0028A06E4D|nr:hypothetical protein [Arthrobacter sp.]
MPRLERAGPGWNGLDRAGTGWTGLERAGTGTSVRPAGGRAEAPGCKARDDLADGRAVRQVTAIE